MNCSAVNLNPVDGVDDERNRTLPSMGSSEMSRATGSVTERLCVRNPRTPCDGIARSDEEVAANRTAIIRALRAG
eukprot:ctg_562.g265